WTPLNKVNGTRITDSNKEFSQDHFLLMAQRGFRLIFTYRILLISGSEIDPRSYRKISQRSSFFYTVFMLFIHR
ncbi:MULTISPECIES: hypothetical protein, partial [Providencia]|uniref:hypothetical protein n=1 Tax=Providencia TaxID=586 RepID=UPI001AB021D2